MRKFLVGLLAVVVAAFLFAGSATPEVSWTGSAWFNLTIDEKGIDVDGGADVSVTWAPYSFSEGAAPVTASFGLSWGGGATFYGISFDGQLVNIDYSTGKLVLDKYFYVGNAQDYVAVSFDAVPFLTIYYADLPIGAVTTVSTDVAWDDAAGSATPVTNTETSYVYSETNIDSEDNAMDDTYFDDFVAVKFTYDMDTMSLKVFGAYYDTDFTDATDYEFGGAVYVTGAGALEGFSAEAAFANLAGNAGTAYGVYATYAFSMTMEPLTVSITPEFKYSENLASMAFANTSDVYYPMVSDGKYVGAAVSLGVNITPIDLTISANPQYDLEKSEFSSDADVNAVVSVDPVSVNADFYISDVMDAANTWDLYATVSAGLDPVSVSAAFRTVAGGDYAYNASVSYTIENGLTATAFYGSLYGDADYDGKADIHAPDKAQWYLKVSYSTSF